MQFQGHVQHPPENRNINGAKQLYVNLNSKIHSLDYLQKFIVSVNLFSEGVLSDLQMVLHWSLTSNSQEDFNVWYVKLLLEDKGTESQKLETQLMQNQKWKQENEHPCDTSCNTELDHNFITRV